MKKKVIYLQENAYSCGSVCIQSIISYYGGYVPLETILDDTNTDITGTNAYEIVKALRKYGFTSYGREVKIADIEENDLPVIAHVIKNGLEHFLVVYDKDESTVTVMDPECGKEVYRLEDFEKIYDNKAIYVHKEGEIPHYKVTHTLIRSLIEVIKRHKRALIVIMILYLLSLGLNLIASFHLKILSTSNIPLKLTISFVLLRTIVYIVLILKNYFLEYLKEIVEVSTITSLTRHIFELPMRFLSRKKTGEIVKKIDDSTFIKDLCLTITIENSLDILLMITSGILMMIISLKLGIIYLSISILVSIVSCKTSAHLYQKNKENIRLHDEYMGSLVEYMSGLESIKNLNRVEVSLNKLSTSLQTFTHNRTKLNNYVLNMEEAKRFILETGLLITNLIGFMSLSENFTFYDLITIQSLYGLFTSSLEGIQSTVYHLHRGKAIYRSVGEFLDIEEETKNGIVISSKIDTLKIKNLTYSYNNINKVVDGVNMTIKKGDKILLRGPSGIGKSTLVKCLCGRFQNYTGFITINDMNIKKIDLKSLREHIVYVGQEEKLFSGTILENIAMDDYDEEKFTRIIEQTALKEVLNKRPEGKNSYVLEGAANLSGGERARLCLARALYKEPDVLIIDETLSSVSEKMEDEILSNLLKERKLTVIYITHRNKEHMFTKIIDLTKERNELNETRY